LTAIQKYSSISSSGLLVDFFFDMLESHNSKLKKMSMRPNFGRIYSSNLYPSNIHFQ